MTDLKLNHNAPRVQKARNYDRPKYIFTVSQNRQHKLYCDRVYERYRN